MSDQGTKGAARASPFMAASSSSSSSSTGGGSNFSGLAGATCSIRWQYERTTRSATACHAAVCSGYCYKGTVWCQLEITMNDLCSVYYSSCVRQGPTRGAPSRARSSRPAARSCET